MKNKPGNKEQRSSIAKQARSGKDMGKRGAGFKKVEEAAMKKYGDKEIAKKVAGSVFWKNMTKKK